MKRIISIMLVLITLITCVSVGSVSVSAAAKRLGDINDFKQTLSYEQYDALRTGKITAEKKGNVWYYKFTTSKYYLFAKVSAFSGSVSNNYSSVNSVLNNGIATTSGVAKIAKYIYKERTAKSSFSNISYTTKSNYLKKNYKNTKINTFTTYITYLKVSADRPDNGAKFDLECIKNGHAEFTYYSKVYINNKNYIGYKTPSTPAEYVGVLKRNITNSTTKTFRPNFDVNIVTPGSNCVHLSSFQLRGKGILDKKTNVSDYVSVATTTVSIVANLVTKKYISAVKSLATLGQKAKNLKTVASEEYISQDKTKLTYSITDTGTGKTKNVKCLRSVFLSPIKIKKSGDYFRSEIQLNKKPSTSKVKTRIEVSFSVK